tara:strand:+ start:378 stop:581 length:204 start_codon:yes stop_codon:yes gene_type:complete
MRKFVILGLLFMISCSSNSGVSNSTNDVQSSSNVITNTSFEFINTSENIEIEDFTDKKTIILFWADY